MIALLKILGRLPWWLLYAISDVAAFVLQYVVRYRRLLVEANLQACYPQWSPQRRRQVRRQFYRNFTDVFVEALRLPYITDAEMEKRMQWGGVETAQRLLDQKRSIVVYFSHCGNWEWAPSVTLHLHGDDVAYGQVYRPLKDTALDAYMLKLRSRFGTVSYPKSTVLRHLLRLRADHRVSMTGFMSDQKPSHGDPTLEVSFLRRPTHMITGTETLARRLEFAAVYWDIRRLRRGYYHIQIVPMTDDAAQMPQGDLTRMYAQMLQATIDRDPAAWLWSHNRWKEVKR